MPLWTDTGVPANAEAGLLDALLWLKTLQAIVAKNMYVLPINPEDNKRRLTLCIAAIEELLGDVE